MGWLSDDRNERSETDKKMVRRRPTGSGSKWQSCCRDCRAAHRCRAGDTAPACADANGARAVEGSFSRLRSLLAQRSLPAFRTGKTEGRIGRIFKDRFLEAAGAGDESASRSALEQSLKASLDTYESNQKN